MEKKESSRTRRLRSLIKMLTTELEEVKAERDRWKDRVLKMTEK